VESYYAVVDTEMFKLGKQVLVPGENTTERGVAVPLEVSRIALPPSGSETPAPQAGAVQTTVAAADTAPLPRPAGPASGTTPLPYLQPADGPARGFTVPSRRENLDPSTEAAIERVLASAPPLKASQTAVVILPEDRDEPTSETVGLDDILQEHLLAGDYAGAESKLQGFLNLRRSEYAEARVRFYLAQAYYFQGLYEEALFEFVLAQDQLYAPVQPWLESCFRHIWERR
jgi:hypothetical protein